MCLVKGSVPSIYITDNPAQVDDATNAPNSSVPSAPVSTNESEHLRMDEVPFTPNLIEIDVPLHTPEPAPQMNLFRLLQERLITPQLPHSGWSMAIRECPKSLVFAEIGPSSSTIEPPWCIKQVRTRLTLIIAILVHYLLNIFLKFVATLL